MKGELVIPSVPQGRGLWDVIMGRPKEDFYIPKTWPDKHPDYGVQPNRRQKKSGSGETVDKSESDDS